MSFSGRSTVVTGEVRTAGEGSLASRQLYRSALGKGQCMAGKGNSARDDVGDKCPITLGLDQIEP